MTAIAVVFFRVKLNHVFYSYLPLLSCILVCLQAMQHCRLKHVQALWLLLSQERAKLQAKYDQVCADGFFPI